MGLRGLVWLGALGAGVALGGSCGLVVDVPEAAPAETTGPGAGGSGGDGAPGGGAAPGGAGGMAAQGGADPCAEGTWCGDGCVDLSADAEHCGACDHSCRGAACKGGFCEREVIATGKANAGWDIVLTDDELVWSGEPVMHAPLASIANAQALLPKAEDLCLLGNDIFALDGETIMRASLGGGLVASFTGTEPNALAIAANKSHLFWLDQAGLHRVDGIDLSTTEIIDPTFVPASLQIGADATHAYVASPGPEPGLWRIELGTKIRTQIVSSQVMRFAIDEAAGDIYFTSNSAVRHVPIDGSLAPVALITGLDAARGIAVDATHVYFVEQGGLGTLNRIAKDGGGHLVLAAGLAAPVGVRVDDSYAYVTESATGSMSRVAK